MYALWLSVHTIRYMTEMLPTARHDVSHAVMAKQA